MPLLIVVLIAAGVVLIYYGVTGKRPQQVIQEAFSGS